MTISSPGERIQELKPPLPFIDLAKQQARLRHRLDAAIGRVLDHGQYIMGPEVGQLEAQLGAFSGARHAISVSSGTDALLVILMAYGIGPGDAVICPAFTYTATPECIAILGATPVLAEVREDTFNIDVERLPGAIAAAKKAGLRPRAIMPVDLFGLPADYDALLPFASANNLYVVSDAAQSFGAQSNGHRVGSFGGATATSFFPSKPLGCYGDGGAIMTDDDAAADIMRSIRLHGRGCDKYDIERVGINGRLDTLQAAILIEKLDIFSDEIERRQSVAERYTAAIQDLVATPTVPNGLVSVWAQYTIRIPGRRRDKLAEVLINRGIPTAIHYPRPLHHQKAYANCPISTSGVDVATSLAADVISLPMHAYLEPHDQDRIIDEVRMALRHL
ncbi:MAG: DegT/DnrJ/EryC1/StrS family aminotransferase [Hyphomicrobiaceae bacterium]